ncbi:tripartite tricarboxylate transporter substrate binding protein [Hominifimenecus sp. rT4P-3]|uniref:tripartite tricarboxylate transporter substrate binding protein n=1 Tax=Hominifimenecus sp. rT4P-3 TaxID=3242979 RepID=UPI003DA6AE63
MKMKRWLSVALAAVMAVSLGACGNSKETTTQADTTKAAAATNAESEATETTAGGGSDIAFPEHDLQGYITYGAGGGTDTISRAIAPGMEAALGQSIVLQNKSGGSGSVGTAHVLGLESDGYSLLFHSESTTLFKALDIIDITYDDLTPIMVTGGGCGVLVTAPDSKYQTFEDVLAAAKENPGTISVGSCGTGTLPDIIRIMMEQVLGVEFNMVSFDGDSEALTALMGGHIDLHVCTSFTAVPMVQSGNIKPLLVFSDEEVYGFEGVPLATSVDEKFNDYLPWGPFYGLSVKAGTDQAIVDKLTDAAKKAYAGEDFQKYLEASGTIPIGLTGEEANEYMKSMQSITCWLLYDAGVTTVEPTEYGVPRPTK